MTITGPQASAYVAQIEAEWGLAASQHAVMPSKEGPDFIDVVTDHNHWTVWLEPLLGNKPYGEC